MKVENSKKEILNDGSIKVVYYRMWAVRGNGNKTLRFSFTSDFKSEVYEDCCSPYMCELKKGDAPVEVVVIAHLKNDGSIYVSFLRRVHADASLLEKSTKADSGLGFTSVSNFKMWAWRSESNGCIYLSYSSNQQDGSISFKADTYCYGYGFKAGAAPAPVIVNAYLYEKESKAKLFSIETL